MSESSPHTDEPDSAFPITRWSLLAAVREPDEKSRFDALSKICETYWFPLYAFLRRQGNSAEDAQDLVQGFFGHLLEKDALAAVDQARGKMRTFMLSSLRRFGQNQHRHAQAQKRGGQYTILSIEKEAAESRLQNETADKTNPETLYEREWALALMTAAYERLEAEYNGSGKSAIFAALRDSLSGDEDRGRYREIAESLDMNEGAVRVAVYRIRKRFRRMLVEEISRTVDTPEAVDTELDHFKAVFFSS